jgi:hypothetical protein
MVRFRDEPSHGAPIARKMSAMQIPYDLEFVENRPTVAARSVALPAPASAWRSERPEAQRDAVDRLLHWAFRLLRRFESGR